MMGHSIVWLGLGIVAFAYWLRAVEFFPNRNQPEFAAEPQTTNYPKTW